MTSPFYTVGIAMQLSVLPHLTIYGDVKPEQIRRTLIQSSMEKVGFLPHFASKSTEIISIEHKAMLTLHEQLAGTMIAGTQRNDLMIASG